LRSSSIYYRVADFLKGFPPFSFIGEEDLLRLAGSGRVKFQESDGYVYWQGGAPGRFVFVIQQGTVELIDETARIHTLRDVLGEGDILGAERLAGKNAYLYSAKTTSDVILYALLADEFQALAEMYPRFARYLASNFSVAPTDFSGKSPGGAPGGPPADRLPIDFLASRLLAAADNASLDEAVDLMNRQGRDTLIATRDGAPVGYLDGAWFRRLSSDGSGPSGIVGEVMAIPLPVLSDALSSHTYALEMLLGGSAAVAILDANGVLKAAVTESDLTLLGVPNLPQLGREIRQSQTLAELSELRRAALRFAAQSLVDPSAVAWVAQAFTELNRLIVSRAIELTEAAADAAPDTTRCWVFFGAAARGELLTGAMPDFGLVFEDGDAEDHRGLGRQVFQALRQCGYHSEEDAMTPANEGACRSLDDWKVSFTRWISDPVLSGLNAGLRFFELAPLLGSGAPVAALRQHIHEEVQRNEFFVPILANDSMANLPPLTFFQGLVVDDDGVRTERFDLRRGALLPLADVGRVFALERADTVHNATIDRLQEAGAEIEEQRELFADAAATYRLALYHQGRVGLRDSVAGWSIEPNALSKLEQQALKNGFRTIMKLLAFTSERNRVAVR
jgi:CBS domain-containing protein